MKLIINGFILLIRKFILRKNTGYCINKFAKKMGITYIKLAQILSVQHCGNLFTEADRIKLSSICDNCNPIKFKKIKKIIEKDYQCKIEDKFIEVEKEPVGAASVSQVHRAILLNGEKVVLKIKRKDITKRIAKDIKQMKFIVHTFGKFFNFKNYLASDKALDMYFEWILEETDFNHEISNLEHYQEFANSVNGKIPKTVNIVLPKVYKSISTKNIIVMEYVDSPTINKINLNTENKNKIKKALNDYICLSFYALFNGGEVTFHGDPHGGNIYFDKNGNFGFLDMGLVFSFSGEEAEFIKKLFFNAYFDKYEDLADILLENSNHENIDLHSYKEDLRKCTSQFRKIPVTNFFVDMIVLYTKYNIDAPLILFKLAKTFITINGINNIAENYCDTEELLKKQVIDYYINNTIGNFRSIINDGIKIIPTFVKDGIQEGFVESMKKQVLEVDKLYSKANNTLNKCYEIYKFLK